MKAQLLFITFTLACLSAFTRPTPYSAVKGAPTEAEVRAYFTKYKVLYRASLRLPPSLLGSFRQGPVVFGLGTPDAPRTVFAQRFMIHN